MRRSHQISAPGGSAALATKHPTAAGSAVRIMDLRVTGEPTRPGRMPTALTLQGRAELRPGVKRRIALPLGRFRHIGRRLCGHAPTLTHPRRPAKYDLPPARTFMTTGTAIDDGWHPGAAAAHHSQPIRLPVTRPSIAAARLSTSIPPLCAMAPTQRPARNNRTPSTEAVLKVE